MVLKANDRRICPCHDEFRGPRSDYVRQVSFPCMPFEPALHPTGNEGLAKAETHTGLVTKYPAWLLTGDESENETTYIFNREVPASYLDTHEMSEAECDRDLHEFCEKNEKFQIFEQYDGQRICIT
ncbi:uncharacterized protein TNCV_3811081 [Trichonephila clavipes]|nr:uncharacterized protein TNCV_3811081 [Trichonephila clavipes]